MRKIRLPTLEVTKTKQAKLFLALLLLILICVLMYWLDEVATAARQTATGQAHSLLYKLFLFMPWKEFANVSLTTASIAVIYEWWIRRETSLELRSQLFSTDIIKEFLPIARVHEIAKASLQRIANDDVFGTELFNFIDTNIVQIHERRYRVRYAITLSNLSGADEDKRMHFYQAHIETDYEKQFDNARIYFMCVDDPNRYNRAIDDKSVEWRWLTSRNRIYKSFGEDFYVVQRFAIEEEELDIEHELGDEGDVIYFVNVPKKFRSGNVHRCSYRIALKQERFGHCLFVDVRAPSKGLYYVFDFAKTDIAHVNVFDAFTSQKRPLVRFLPELSAFHRVEVGLENEWVIPKSGVSFTWILKSELTPEAKRAALS